MPLRLNDYDIAIRSSNGLELTPYSVDTSDARTTSCYIESREGERFSIEVGNGNPEGYAAYGRLYLDGRLAQTFTILPHEKDTFTGVSETLDSVNPFRFSKIAFIEEKDGECGLGCTGNVDQIGTIEIRMHRVVIEQIVDGDEKDYIASKLTHFKSALTVSEEKKFLDFHCVLLEDREPLKGVCVVDHIKKAVDPESDPRAVFRFRHFSMDALQARGIVTVETCPKQLSSPGNSPRNLKRSRSAAGLDQCGNTRSRKRGQLEHANEKYLKGGRTFEKEVIDLTGDS